jgi:hypothetical protein
MPSATYKAVVFESLLGGIKELSLDKMKDKEEKFAALDKYLTEGFKAKPELAGMILKYFAEAEGVNKPVDELIRIFQDMFVNICLVPPYEGTKFTIDDSGYCTERLMKADSAFNKYLTEQFESIKKSAAG